VIIISLLVSFGYSGRQQAAQDAARARPQGRRRADLPGPRERQSKGRCGDDSQAINIIQSRSTSSA